MRERVKVPLYKLMVSDTSENGKQISLKEKASTILQAVHCTKVNSLMVRERDKGP